MRKRTASGKAHPLAVIILAFFHRFSYHYGALSQKAVRQDGLFFYKKGDLNSRGHLERSRRKSGMLLILLYLIASYCT